jgi:hypothetical protein
MEDERFDALTRSLAKPVSRRQVLKVLMASTVGALLVRQGAGGAWAEKGGNSDCAHWCNAHFAGEDRGDCKSDAAHGKGLCHSPCGPGGGGGTLCGGPGYDSTTCCTSGQNCVDGTCASCPPGSALCNGSCCPLRANTTASCVNGTCTYSCTAGRVMVANGTCALPCTTRNSCAGAGCLCGTDSSGANYCMSGIGIGGTCITTDSDADCPLGEVCGFGACFHAC